MQQSQNRNFRIIRSLGSFPQWPGSPMLPPFSYLEYVDNKVGRFDRRMMLIILALGYEAEVGGDPPIQVSRDTF